MAQTITFDGSTLSTVRPQFSQYVEVAHNGEVGSGSVQLDDDAGALTFAGFKDFHVVQSSAPSDNQRVYTGSVQDKQYHRGDMEVAASRETVVTLYDTNDLLGRLVITGSDGNRPAESVGARLVWLLASSYVEFTDAGFVVYPSTQMDKTDYRGQNAGNVLADMVALIGFNYFTYYDEASDAVALFFDNSNVSTTYTSTAKISNVEADSDGTTVFAPLQDAELERTPENVASGAFEAWERGNTYRTKSATATAFAPRDVVLSSSQAKTLTLAQRAAEKYLATHSEEDDTITCSIWCEPANVNDIRAGHRLQVKFTHLPGYESYTWVRVLRRTVSQPQGTDTRYQVALELSPQRVVSCSTEINRAHGTVTGEVALESGSTTLAHGAIPGWFGIIPPDDAVSTIPVVDPTNANDSDVTTYSSVGQYVLRSPGSVAAYWISTFDDTYDICSVRGTTEIGSNSWRSRAPDSIDYWDGSEWITAPGSYTYDKSTIPNYWVFTLSETISTTQLRLRYVETTTSTLAFGLWNWMPLGLRVYDWLVYGS